MIDIVHQRPIVTSAFSHRHGRQRLSIRIGFFCFWFLFFCFFLLAYFSHRPSLSAANEIVIEWIIATKGDSYRPTAKVRLMALRGWWGGGNLGVSELYRVSFRVCYRVSSGWCRSFFVLFLVFFWFLKCLWVRWKPRNSPVLDGRPPSWIEDKTKKNFHWWPKKNTNIIQDRCFCGRKRRSVFQCWNRWSPAFTEFQWKSFDGDGFYWVLLGFTRFHLVLLGFTGFYWVLLGFTGFYWVLLGFTGFYWLLLSLTGFHWFFTESKSSATTSYAALLGFYRFHFSVFQALPSLTKILKI